MFAEMKSDTKSGGKPKLTPQNSTDSKTAVAGAGQEQGGCEAGAGAGPVVGGEQLTASEMENVTTVFRYFETGLREATILPKVDMCR